jgi:hypothetical protein
MNISDFCYDKIIFTFMTIIIRDEPISLLNDETLFHQ